MLLPWRDSVRIFIGPRQVVMLRLSGSIKKRIVAKQILDCDSSSQINPWQAAFLALQEALRHSQWRDANAHVTLSNHFVHYALIPWNEDVVSEKERAAYLRHHFDFAYESGSKNWDLRVSYGGFNGKSLASGIDRTLLDELRALFAQTSLRLASISPYLMSAYNHGRHAIGMRQAWFVLIERGVLCLALLNHGQWQSMRSMPVESDWVDHLETLLARESVLAGLNVNEVPIYLSWPEKPDTQPVINTKAKIHQISNTPRFSRLMAIPASYRLALW
ncbi:MAG: hypothetical protein ACAH10_05540 [Methylophilaceae bacterium]